MKNPDEFTVGLEAGACITALAYRSESDAAPALILGHGAGAGQHSPFMVAFAQALAARGIDTYTFNFPYIEQRRRIPDRRPVLDACYLAVIEQVQARAGAATPLFIGGKSMGGRIATHVAAADPSVAVSGLVLLGYPLHPPGRPQQRRDAHLPDIRRPVLIVQGSGDTFGTPAELAPAMETMSPAPTLHVIPGGDHSFKVSRGGKGGQATVYEEIQRTIAEWIAGVSAGVRGTRQPRD